MATSQELAILITGKNQASKAFDSAAKSAGGFGKAITDVAKIAGGFVLAKGLLELPKLFDGPVKAASNLSESINAVQVVFGKASDKILEFGKTSATQVGLSQRAFNELATPLGAMLKNSGLNLDQVADSTVMLTKRAADMASVFNTDVDSALGAITAALRGETDPIERYGVSVSAAKVEMEAMAQTGKKSASSLTDQEKAAARLRLIMMQTRDVAGDFVNTSDGLANKQRIQAARSEEVSAALGAKLMPVMLKFKEIQLQVVEALGAKLIPFLEGLSEKYMPQISAAFDQAVEAVTPFVEQIQPFFEALSQNEEVMSRVAAVVGGALVAAFAALAISAGAAAVGVIAAVAPFLAIGAAIAALSLGVRELIIHWDEITAKYPILGQAVDAVKQKFADLKVYWETQLFPAIGRIKDRVVDVVTAIVGFLQDNWGLIKDIMVGAVTVAYDLLKIPFDNIRGLFKIVIDIINGDWSKAWEDLKELAVNAVNNTYTLIKDAFGLWKDIGKLLYEIGVAIIQGLWDGMKDKFEGLADWIDDKLGGIPGRVKDLFDSHSPSKVMQDIGEDVMQGYINGLKSKWGDVESIFEGLKNFGDYKSPADAAQAFLGTDYDTAMRTLERLANSIGNGLYEDGSMMRGAAQDMTYSLKQNIPHISAMGEKAKEVASNFQQASQQVVQTAESLKASTQGWAAVPGVWNNFLQGGTSSPAPSGLTGGQFGGAITLPEALAIPGWGVGIGATTSTAMREYLRRQGLGYNGPPGSATTAPVINVNVEGSIRSDRDLAAVLAEQLALGAGRGVL